MTKYQYRTIRKNLLLSQPLFGSLVGANELTVSRWENGHCKPQTLQAAIYKLLKGCEWGYVQCNHVKEHLKAKKNLRALAYIIFEALLQKERKSS